MRMRQITILFLGFLFLGCGGGKNTTNGGQDSGTDAAVSDGAVDAAGDAANDAAGDADTDSDTDSDSDTDGDTDSDTDTDGDADSGMDAGSDAAADAGTDAGGFAGVLCGYGICDPGQHCCVTESPVSQECTDYADCATDFQVDCDGPEDCGGPGNECCMPSGAISRSSCINGHCMAGMSMCHTQKDCDLNEYCCPSVFFGYPYKACQSSSCH